MITNVMRELRRERRIWVDKRREARKIVKSRYPNWDLAAQCGLAEANGAIWAIDACIRRMGGV